MNAHHRSTRRSLAGMGRASSGHEMGAFSSSLARWYPGRSSRVRRRLFALLALELRADDSHGRDEEMGYEAEFEGYFVSAFCALEIAAGDFRCEKR